MAGAYCKFCDRRCFVYRAVIVGGEVIWAGHMATCSKGAEHDRKVLGQDFTTAHNPMTEGQQVAQRPLRVLAEDEWPQ